MLYVFDDLENFTDIQYISLFNTLPRSRMEKCYGYKYIIDKKLSLLGYCLLRYAMKSEYRISDFEVVISDYGKPYFTDRTLPEFSIGHCKLGVIVALHSERLGVDIEQNDVYSEDISQFVMSQDERNTIQQSEDKSAIFSLIWTKKEAYYKFLGTGIDDKIKTILDEAHMCTCFYSIQRPSYTISLCSTSLDGFNFMPIHVSINNLLVYED